MISFFAILHLFSLLISPLSENVLQVDARQPSGGFADSSCITEAIPPGAVVGPTWTTLRMLGPDFSLAIVLMPAKLWAFFKSHRELPVTWQGNGSHTGRSP